LLACAFDPCPVAEARGVRITVAEFLFTARIVGAENFRYLELMAVCGLAYMALSLIFAGGAGSLELRLPWATHYRNTAR
jgi:ABC-type amino acid transport system permease subunit